MISAIGEMTVAQRIFQAQDQPSARSMGGLFSPSFPHHFHVSNCSLDFGAAKEWGPISQIHAPPFEMGASGCFANGWDLANLRCWALFEPPFGNSS